MNASSVQVQKHLNLKLNRNIIFFCTDVQSPCHSGNTASSSLNNVLFPGDIVSNGCHLQSKLISPVSVNLFHLTNITNEFQVVHPLGTGSYTIIYPICEIIASPPSLPPLKMVMQMGLAPWTCPDTATSTEKKETRVIVKLTNFRLSTRDVKLSHMDCGLAGYMSYCVPISFILFIICYLLYLYHTSAGTMSH